MEFKDAGTEDIGNSVDSRKARQALPVDLHTTARRRLDIIANATSLADLAIFRGLRLEALKGDRVGQHSIRINDRYRVCFVWTDAGAKDVEIVDYH